MARNRVIYQSDALFVATGTPNPTGVHTAADIGQLHRVQSANYGFSIARQNINQFGNLARIDSIIMDAPTVNMDFTYYLGSGTNEALLGFNVGSDVSTVKSFISGLVDTTKGATISGRNFHIFTAPEGNDANGLGGSDLSFTGVTASTISIGNGFVTNYSVDAAVGSIPKVNISVEGLNINVCDTNTGVVPGIVIESSATGSSSFTLPAPVTGDIGVTALRPGDIKMLVAEGYLVDMPTGADTGSNNTAAHIQSFSISCPIKRTTLQRLGNSFGYAKVIDFPVEVTVNVSATVADLRAAGNLANVLTSDSGKTLQFNFNDSSGTTKLAYRIKNAKLVSENLTSSIGANKKVDLVFTSQIGGPQDDVNGLFVATGGALPANS